MEKKQLGPPWWPLSARGAEYAPPGGAKACGAIGYTPRPPTPRPPASGLVALAPPP